MVFKKKKSTAEIAEEEELEEEESDEEETSPSAIRKAVVGSPNMKSRETQEKTDRITVNDVLLNHEDRLKNIESAFFRLKNIV